MTVSQETYDAVQVAYNAFLDAENALAHLSNALSLACGEAQSEDGLEPGNWLSEAQNELNAGMESVVEAGRTIEQCASEVQAKPEEESEDEE